LLIQPEPSQENSSSLEKGLKAWSRELSRLNTLIHNSSWVLALLDGLEEARPLSVAEKNFRGIVKTYLAKLLESKRTYWRQNAIIRFVRFGDENTKLFQATATHTPRKNQIIQLFLTMGAALPCIMRKLKLCGPPSRLD
jgi:hypothetical protein